MVTAQKYPKPKKTLKSPTVQAQVLTRRANGDSKLKISKDLKMSRNTVISILDLNNYEQTLQSERVSSLSLIPAARKAVEHRLKMNDGNIGIKVLENTIWPLNEKQGKSSGDPSLVLAIQNLMGNVTVAPSSTTISASEESPKEQTPANSNTLNES